MNLDAMLVRLEPHEPDDRCRYSHCYSHHVDEPGAGYLVCPECFHLYRKPRSLRAAMRWRLLRDWRHPWSRPTLRGRPYVPDFRLSLYVWLRMYLTVRASRIWACPYCAHDF